MLENHETSEANPAALNWTVHQPPDENRIRIVLLDDHGLFRASLARLLASEAGLEVAGECGTPAEALELIHSSDVDVVLLDFDVGSEHATDFISAARKAGYQGRFLIVSGTVDAERSAMALKLGVSGIFLKSEGPERLIQAIRMIASGAVWVDQKVIQVIANQCLSQPRRADQRSGGVLDGREQRAILGILGGLTNRKIADGMGISESAVKNVLQGLFTRTGVRTRSQLVRLALEGSLGNVHQLMQREGKAHEDGTPAQPLPGSHSATPTHS
jgi:two-component system, NarL family, nitrate/nitrite response regulator NarL